ncbi:MAG: polyprenyl synthetase family protein [Parcubacteria group bacterium]
MKKYSKPFIEKLKDYKKLVEGELKFFFAKQIQESRNIDGSASQMMRALEEFTLRGGKRIRASLTGYGYKCFSQKKIDRDIIRASMANELVQSGLLIHDDIIDRDDLRRGKSTFHKIYEQIGKQELALNGSNPEKVHFGMVMAILAGDIALSLANIILSEIEVKNKLDMILTLNKVIRNTTFGQIIDVRSGYAKTFSPAAALLICELKTAYYSVENPLVLGALLAQASAGQIKKIKEFAVPLGLAFAIQDDILDLFGEEAKIGKPLGSDLKEGKKTFLFIKALESAKGGEKKFLLNILGKQNITAGDIGKVKNILLKTGALEYCTAYSRELINKAKDIIRRQRYQPEGEEFLLGMADYLLSRKY